MLEFMIEVTTRSDRAAYDRRIYGTKRLVDFKLPRFLNTIKWLCAAVVGTALGVSGCDSVVPLESGQAAEIIDDVGKIEWGVAKSEELSIHLCNAPDVFSTRIEFGRGVPSITPEIEERILCGMPRPRSEPILFEVDGKIIGKAFSRAGDIVSRCEVVTEFGLSVDRSNSSADQFICSGPPEHADLMVTETLPETVTINIVDFQNSDGTIRSADLNLKIAEVGGDRVTHITVPPGTYLLEEAIRSEGSIILVGAGPGLSTIIGAHPGMSSILEVYPSYKARLELSVTANHGSRLLYLNGTPEDHWRESCSRIVIRDKSQIWPWDERNYVFFGEVADVTHTYQGLVILSDPTTDAYYRGAEVSLVCPSEVSVRDISLEFANPALGTKALSISGADPVTVSNVDIKNTGRVGVWIEESANILVSETTMSNGFPAECDTCYGIQTYGAIDALLRDNLITGFRRGIDISGTIASRRVVVKSNVVVAESDTSRGASGIGTHGSAEGVIFTDNDVSGGIVSLLIRGNKIMASKNRLVDSEYSSVYLASGGTHYINKNELGGVRSDGRDTNRGVDFHVPSMHSFTRISGNSMSARVGVRIAQTPGVIEIFDNEMQSAGTSVEILENVILDDDDVVSTDW